MRFDTIFSAHLPENIRVQCGAFKKALHERSPEIVP
jgi:hypothetical protein